MNYVLTTCETRVWIHFVSKPFPLQTFLVRRPFFTSIATLLHVPRCHSLICIYDLIYHIAHKYLRVSFVSSSVLVTKMGRHNLCFNIYGLFSVELSEVTVYDTFHLKPKKIYKNAEKRFSAITGHPTIFLKFFDKPPFCLKRSQRLQTQAIW